MSEVWLRPVVSLPEQALTGRLLSPVGLVNISEVRNLMSKSFLVSLLISFSVVFHVTADDESEAERFWPQWRGPWATGVAPHGTPPLEWSENKNIRWKTDLPGLGHATPIIWGDRIFVTTAIAFGDAVDPMPDTAPGAHDNSPVTHHHQFVVLAINRADGKIVWRKTLNKKLPHEGGHYTGSLASNSPVTDGKHVLAFFGSHGLYCLDFNGELKWKKDLGKMLTKHAHGEGASPVLFGDTLVVNWDHRGQSFVVAIEKTTGKQRWRVDRDEVTSWATPIVVNHKGKPQVIVSGTGRVRAYDLNSGKVVWECEGLSNNVVASPVYGDGMVFSGSSYDTRNMLAIRLDGAKGDITDSKNLVWSRRRGPPYVPSPLLYDDSLYFLAHYQAILSRVNTKTGNDSAGPFRLDGIRDIYASPVGANGRIYLTDREGVTLVLSHSKIPRVLAVNKLEDSFSASAAIVGSELFLRGKRHLYCIGEE